ncbi:MAG: hypothetical protein HOA72_23640 [Desulfobacula sp.]|jgi:hypothetical protein|uniref:hypothetical protein n=1 Tax=Desulfobacula sp. TaxID=2593537 RepID=UPI001D8F5C90|nr:hypothetical protein [Desulfobacula sp.]MBT6340235.1 hypothetical protein [Desulfobacula sp.]MBT6751913.1 hypothetical protein [Desulfobacula sp.]MBT7631675.1 hypothetical protein [Desulfobacula sp.]
MKQLSTKLNPTLPEVQSMFATWRKNKQHRNRIPDYLWEAAASLVPAYSIHKVVIALSLSHRGLKNRVEANKAKIEANIPSGFIPIDIPQQHSVESIIEMAHKNGNKMRMHLKGMGEVNLHAFVESFWR